ncbi:MAG: hypothetical protein DMF58_18040 [Acidobacteria bacterium]|nr:MAG: hypothetical protein DMF58_18040 [Acidobacteriota bacterium]
MRKPGAMILVSVFLCASLFALNNRSAVSLTGSDLATCTVPDPCRTFDVAISKTNAGGEVVVLSTAGYGPFTVTKSVSVISPPAYHAAMAPTAGAAITIDTAGVTVILRNLYLNSLGAPTGIAMTADASVVHVENLVINGFTSNGIEANGNFTATSQLFIKDTEVRGSGQSGIYAGPSAGKLTLAVDRARLEANVYGLVMDSGVEMVMRDSTALNSSSVGVYVRDNGVLAPATAWIDRSMSAQNLAAGFLAQVGGLLTISNSVAARNSDGFRAENASQLAADHCVASENTNGFLLLNAIMTVSKSMATRNSSDGIAAINSGTAFVSDNTVTENNVGLHVTAAAVMESISNNMVRGNTTNVSGTVTAVAAN